MTGADGQECKADFSFLTASSVLFDAVYVPGGDASATALKEQSDASSFVEEAYKHCKAIAASGAGVGLLARWLGEKFSESNTTGKLVADEQGVVTSRGPAADNFATAFINAIAQHRHWERELNPTG